jgi:hypothetical protein
MGQRGRTFVSGQASVDVDEDTLETQLIGSWLAGVYAPGKDTVGGGAEPEP